MRLETLSVNIVVDSCGITETSESARKASLRIRKQAENSGEGKPMGSALKDGRIE